MAIMILAISLLLNVIQLITIHNMRLGWKDDVERFNKECHYINNTWAAKCDKLIDDLELEYDMEDDDDKKRTGISVLSEERTENVAREIGRTTV